MKEKNYDLPSPQQIEDELNRVRYRQRYRTVLRSTIYTLITVAAVAVLVWQMFRPHDPKNLFVNVVAEREAAEEKTE